MPYALFREHGRIYLLAMYKGTIIHSIHRTLAPSLNLDFSTTTGAKLSDEKRDRFYGGSGRMYAAVEYLYSFLSFSIGLSIHEPCRMDRIMPNRNTQTL